MKLTLILLILGVTLVQLVYSEVSAIPACVPGNEASQTIKHATPHLLTAISPVYIKYPSYNAHYERNITCFWRLDTLLARKEVTVHFELFNLENSHGCTKDYLLFHFPDSGSDRNKDIKFCGQSYPKSIDMKLNRYIDITFRSDEMITGTGFKLKFELLPAPRSKVFSLKVEHSPMYIFSPGYPGDYYKSLIYTWSLEALVKTDTILLEFSYLDLEDDDDCSYDFVSISGYKTNYVGCGLKKQFILAMNDTIVNITLNTDSVTMHSGFIIRYYSVPSSDGQICQSNGNTLTALQYRPQVINVVRTNGRKCIWLINATETEVINFELLSVQTEQGSCRLKLSIIETGSSFTKEVFNCATKALKYYRSRTGSIKVTIDDTSQIHQLNGQLSFSYNSIPHDVLSDEIIIDNRPSFLFFPKPGASDISIPHVVVKAEHGDCIQMQVYGDDMSKLTSDTIPRYLQVFNGRDDVDGHSLLSDCGGPVREEISGTNRYMFIRGNTWTSNRKGVWLRLETAGNCFGNIVKIRVGDSTQTITSPNYPNPYPRNAFCQWELVDIDKTKSAMIQSQMKTRPRICEDVIHIYNSVSDSSHGILGFNTYDWCRTSSSQYISPSQKANILLVFKSDNDDNNGEFKLFVTQTAQPFNPVACAYKLTAKPDTEGFFTSPNYPQTYPNNLRCNWLIETVNSNYNILLKIYDVQFSILCDKLTITSGSTILASYCNGISTHSNKPKSFESSGDITVHFTSDSVKLPGDKGFNMSYEAVRKQDPDNYCNKEYQAGLVDNYISYNRSREDLPEKCYYRIHKDDTYIYHDLVVTVIHLDFWGNSNNCKEDYVGFYDGSGINGINQITRLCGKITQSKTIKVTTNSLYINVRTDNYQYNLFNSFDLKYSLQTRTSGGCSTGRPLILTARDYPQEFTSPNYPQNYELNQYCQWRIETENISAEIFIVIVVLELEYVSNGVYYDYVEFYDGMDRYSKSLGKFAGQEIGSFQSDGNKVFVEFQSDSQFTYSGFKIRYAQREGTPIPLSQESNLGEIVIGCIVGTIVLLTLLVVCGIRACRKNNERRRNHSNSNNRRRPSGNVYNRTNNTVFVISPVVTNNSTLPPPYPGVSNSLSDLPPAYTLPAYSQLLAEDNPPPYCELPSYEDSSQFEIPSHRSVSSSNEVLNTRETQSEVFQDNTDNHSPRDQTQTYVGSQENLVSRNISREVYGIDNPAVASTYSSITTEV